MVKGILTAFLLSPLVLMASCSGSTGIPVATSAAPEKPLIDTRVPAATETATFALG
jgi:hypothetical protein